MSAQQKIDSLKQALEDLGISYDADFYGETDSYEISGEGANLLFSIRVPAPDRELPEELKPFGWSDYEVDRAISKGNADKRTLSGARYELALTEYAHRVFRQIPEIGELEAAVETLTTMDKLNAYQDRRTEIWQKMWAENTRLQELQKDLDENYY